MSILLEQIKQNLDLENKIFLKTKFVRSDDYQSFFALFQYILNKIDKLYLAETIFTIFKEMLGNANRSILKREFFLQNNIDVSNVETYQAGITKFKEEFLVNLDNYPRFMDNSKFEIKITISIPDNSFIVEIETNSPLYKIEQERIQSKFENAKKFNNILVAYKQISDKQESAGLGIIMSILLLKNIGLSEENLIISSNESSAYAKLTIPSVLFPVEVSTTIKEQILKEIQLLPSLPKSLTKIIDMCKSKDLDLNKLTLEIEKNPSISAGLLKLSNTPGFLTRNKTNSILQAVKIVGSNNILHMLYAVSTQKIMKDRFPKMEAEWEHAKKVSYFAQKISHRNNMRKNAEMISVGGLLHGIGKILLLSVNPDLFPLISQLTQNRNMEHSKVLEESSIGLSHSHLGAMLADKWNFPNELVDMIKYHQQPYLSGESSRNFAEIVYLANMLANKTINRINFFSVDIAILSKYNLSSQKEFDEYALKLDTLYKKELSSEN